MSSDTHDIHTRRLLDKVAEVNTISQRDLSKELGIALGLTNLLLRRTVRKGWVRLVRLRRNRVKYLVTPAGLAQKARMSRDYFAESIRFYAQTRDRIRGTFAAMIAEAEAEAIPGGCRRIVFYGGGEIAEIAFICLQEFDLQLVAVIDEHRTRPFFGMAVSRPDALTGLVVGGQRFDRLVVMSFSDLEPAVTAIGRCGVPPTRVVWL